ncbi:MAG: response regulator [Planctomycetes bacterium]|nr:response regulator [Planctomycetota bacterium]
MDSVDPPEQVPQTVDVGPSFAQVFLDAEESLRPSFTHPEQSPGLARVQIGDERYILVRAASVSLRFLERFREVLGSLLDEEESEHAAREVLYDLAHAIGRSDAKAILVGVEERERRLSFGPVHFAYTGWARVRLHPDSDPGMVKPHLHYDHLHSFEADSFLSAGRSSEVPVCVMSAGYSAGWVSESFGIRLESAEISCRARGDKTCSFVMAEPDALEARIAAVADRYENLAPPPPYLLGERLLDKLAATERERDSNRESLREQQATLSAFFDQAPIGAFFTVQDGERVLVAVANPAAKELLGDRKLLGEPLEEVLGLKEPEAILSACQETLAGSRGAYHGPELAYVGREEGVLEVNVFSIGGGQLAVLFRDRTAALRAEAAQREAERLEATATLAGGIAHDFNNLMTGVLSHLSVLRRSQPPWAETDLILGEIEEAAHFASRLSLQLVSYARGGKYDAQRLRLADLVTDCLADYRAPPLVQIDFNSDTMRDEVVGDRRQLSRLLQELLSNAVEASGEEGQIVVRVGRTRLSPEEDGPAAAGPYVVLEVSDEGAGIPLAVQERMFEPYFSTRSRGRGLGLAAAYGIVKNHGGAFVVKSQPGFATCIQVLLPAAGTRNLSPPPELPQSPFAGNRALPRRVTPPLPTVSSSLTDELAGALEAARAAEEALRAKLPADLVPAVDQLSAALACCDDLTSRLSEQQLSDQRQPLGRISDPGSLVRAVSERLEGALPEGTKLEVVVEEGLPVLEGARRALENALLNLAFNSRDALGEGGGSVTIRARSEAGELWLEVEDSGPGIPADVLDRAREPFFTTKKEGGTGLGLSLVERVAQAHGGRLELQSSAEGTRAALVLPVVSAPKEAAQPRATVRVLIVDDNTHVGRSTARLLELEGFETELVETGGGAIEAFNETFDVVLLDLVLPDQSGQEVFRVLRTKRPDLPVVLFSGYGEQADVSRLLAEGAHFIPKPFEVEELLRALEKAVGSAGAGPREP